MRILIVVAVSIFLGLTLGLGATVFELGLRPDGSGRIELGPAHVAPTPPPPAIQGPPPKAVVEGGQLEFNFGKADKGTPQHHDFVIRNVGKGTLVLEKGETSCSCTVSEIEHPEVPPGGSTKVTIEWKGKAMGPFRNSAPVLTNDPDQRRIDLFIAGEIVSTYRVEPEKLVFTSISSKKSATQTARIYSFATTDLAVLRHEFSGASTAAWFDLAIEKMSADELKQEVGAKSGCILRLTIKPGLPAGPFAQTIRLQFNLPGDPEIELPVEGKVNSPIEVVGPNWEPERGILMLGEVRASDGAKADLFLLLREVAQDKVNLRLTGPTLEPLKVTIGKLEKLPPSAARIPLTIEVPRGARAVNHLGNDQGKLARVILDTGLPDAPQLQILVRYVVKE
ncbi:MAG TPA: DUF1573 domain-containing protein [Pirellulales bacterium]|jgi:hypothetical protein|nr:DUF1573 domain-containing protein [Pirellulales bacterium]